jgi:hypothetical protein
MSNLESFVDMLHENSNADFVKTESGETILLVKRVEEEISNHVENIGEGNVFSKAWTLEELKPSLEKLTPTKSGVYEGKMHNVGFQLIAERKDVVPMKKLVGYSEDKRLVESKTIKVASIPQHIESFKTDDVSYTLRSVDLDEAEKDFTQFEDDAREGKLFILEDVAAGKPFQGWKDDMYILFPKG